MCLKVFTVRMLWIRKTSALFCIQAPYPTCIPVCICRLASGAAGQIVRTCADTYRNKPLMLLDINAESEELRNLRLLQRRFMVYNPSKAAHMDSAAEGPLALASERPPLAGEGQLQAPDEQCPAGPASHAATQSSHPGRHRHVLNSMSIQMLSALLTIMLFLLLFFLFYPHLLPLALIYIPPLLTSV